MKVLITCLDIGIDVSKKRLDWLGSNKNLILFVFYWTPVLLLVDQ